VDVITEAGPNGINKSISTQIFTIVVSNVNDAPEIISFLPTETTIGVSSGSQEFSITAEDIDLDELIYSWFLNEEEQIETVSTFTRTFMAGTHSVKAVVSDGVLTDEVTWTIISSSSIDGNLPLVTKLSQNYPNPFNPTTKINYQLHEASPVIITVYNHRGETVRRLLDKNNLEAGRYSISWNGKSDYGSTVAGGLYFYSIKTNSYQNVKKAIMVK